MISSSKRKNSDRDIYSSAEFKKEKLSCNQVDDNEKIKKIIKSEFSNEISKKENEVSIIEERLKIVQKTLHLLRYVCVVSFYNRKPGVLVDQNKVDQRENANSSDEQFKLHPAVKKIIGQNNVQFEPLRTRRKPTQKKEDGNVNLNTVGFEISTEKLNDASLPLNISSEAVNETSTSNLNPEQNVSSSCTVKNKATFLSSSSRNERYKNKHCIIIGNISKWNPPDSKIDKFTYKWMVYVRGPKENPDISFFVKKIRFFLHPSYQPNDVVEVTHPPFHIVRRGWGEFPLRVQVHFHNKMNKPLDIIHTLKLDQFRSGLQTLGAETVVDVWIYTEIPSLSQNEPSSLQTKLISETLDFENNEDEIINNHSDSNNADEIFDNYKESRNNSDTVHNLQKTLLSTNNEKLNNHVLENNFNKSDLSNSTTNLNKINLKENNIESNDFIKTEILNHCKSDDKTIDNQKTIRIINSSNHIKRKLINSNQIIVFKKNNTQSLLKPRNQISLLKNNKNNCNNHLLSKVPIIARSIDDIHNYCQILKNSDPDIFLTVNKTDLEPEDISSDHKRYEIEFPDRRFNRVTSALNYLLRRLPVITSLADDPLYLKLYPYTACTLEQYLSWNNAKKFYSEWYRAKVIKRILDRTSFPGCENWSVKAIIKYSQLNGYSYYKCNNSNQQCCKTVPQSISSENNIINSFTFSPKLLEIINCPKSNSYNQKTVSHDEDEIDILNTEPAEVKKTNKEDNLKNIKHLMQDGFSTLPRQYIKDTCEKLGIKLIPEEIVSGVWYSASETVILTAVKCLADELIRKSLMSCAIKQTVPNKISIQNVQEALARRPEFDLFSNYGLGKQ